MRSFAVVLTKARRLGRERFRKVAKEIKEQTGTDTLEDAFLKLTGSTIRDESADSADQMRQFAKMWSGGKR